MTIKIHAQVGTTSTSLSRSYRAGIPTERHLDTR